MLNKVLAFLCLLAILPLPYAYYTALRPLVCLGLIFLLVSDWKKLDDTNKAICIVIAIVFNPFAPIYLSKAVWAVIDIASGIYLFSKYPKKSN